MWKNQLARLRIYIAQIAYPSLVKEYGSKEEDG
jgi:hypothetical protein